MHGKINANWLQVLIAKFLGAVCAIGGGLSLGREGPSIQLGAMVGKGFSRVNNRFRTEEKLLMTCGAGAGLAAAFSAPLAGVVFSLEELHKSFSTEVLLSTMASAITADWIASYIFGLRPVFELTVTNGLPLSHFGWCSFWVSFWARSACFTIERSHSHRISLRRSRSAGSKQGSHASALFC